MTRNTLLVCSALIGLVLVVGMVGEVAACPNCWRHASTWTSEDRARAERIRRTYDGDLNSLETQLRSVSRELGQAVAAEDTKRTEELRQKLTDLERAYDAVRADLRDDLRQAGLSGYRGAGNWNCQWHDHHAWRGEGHRMGGNHGQGRHWGCCW